MSMASQMKINNKNDDNDVNDNEKGKNKIENGWRVMYTEEKTQT